MEFKIECKLKTDNIFKKIITKIQLNDVGKSLIIVLRNY